MLLVGIAATILVVLVVGWMIHLSALRQQFRLLTELELEGAAQIVAEDALATFEKGGIPYNIMIGDDLLAQIGGRVGKFTDTVNSFPPLAERGVIAQLQNEEGAFVLRFEQSAA